MHMYTYERHCHEYCMKVEFMQIYKCGKDLWNALSMTFSWTEIFPIKFKHISCGSSCMKMILKVYSRFSCNIYITENFHYHFSWKFHEQDP